MARNSKDKYREAFAKTMKIKDADPVLVVAQLAKRFRVTTSAIHAATREMRADMGLVRRRPNNKKGRQQKKMSRSEAARVAGLARGAQRRSKALESPWPVGQSSASAAWDLTNMPVDQAARVLQVLSAQWPALRAAFFELDQALVTS